MYTKKQKNIQAEQGGVFVELLLILPILLLVIGAPLQILFTLEERSELTSITRAVARMAVQAKNTSYSASGATVCADASVMAGQMIAQAGYSVPAYTITSEIETVAAGAVNVPVLQISVQRNTGYGGLLGLLADLEVEASSRFALEPGRSPTC